MIKKFIRTTAEYLTNTNIFRSLPRGGCVFNDISVALPQFKFNVIFDVGANVGQSAKSYVKQMPKSTIYCFEPVHETFKTLQINTKHYSQVKCYNCALSSEEGVGKIVKQEKSSRNYMISEEDVANFDDDELETIEVGTLDRFCLEERISKISYLKIDTEGRDFEVLLGSQDKIRSQNVDFIEVETGMSVFNDKHVPFCEIKSHLENSGYHLFGIYEQIAEWPERKPNLRRVNSVYIANNLVE